MHDLCYTDKHIKLSLSCLNSVSSWENAEVPLQAKQNDSNTTWVHSVGLSTKEIHSTYK